MKLPPARQWRSYGTKPLPTPAEALDLSLGAFPSWFLKITCDRRQGPHTEREPRLPATADMPLRVLIARMRRDGCGGRAGRVELLTGIDGVGSRPVRRIVLQAG